ncbi:hypothetical protein GCM10007036_16620 [Alsobacter metallidurans]|uniref:Three-Cys-motif partner protein TcmP n=1 Tax=Alsobacter metallidurans TaxID=340221 RepID=A0A917I6P4_9HYPH|nr:three-Cys-motif partner protein TcmP [Alsobacter metallidurans]GGH16152.1 hypothetical protein GCM10007036_16620 [Alsobacter metallidurans]
MNDDLAVVGPWAAEKLGDLREYLEFYTKVLKNQHTWCQATIFVDAFAGAGRARIRTKERSNSDDLNLFHEFESVSDTDEIQYLNGSPRVALSISNPFSRYIFIERDPDRVSKLNELCEEFGLTRTMTVRSGDANAELLSIAQSGTNWRVTRAVAFLDPFGMHVPWETIVALAKTQAVEVIINFPLGMAIQRLIPRSGDLTPARREALDSFFGTPDWWDQAYETNSDLFGPKTIKLRDSGKRLLGWYRERLRAAFGHVSAARLIRNTRGGHLYYLIWAGPHPLGLKGANAILNKGDRVKL